MIYNHVELNLCRAFAPAGANNIKSVFDRGAYVVEHTVRRKRANRVLRGESAAAGRNSLPEKAVPFPAKLRRG